jgi:hypothetical protein
MIPVSSGRALAEDYQLNASIASRTNAFLQFQTNCGHKLVAG